MDIDNASMKQTSLAMDLSSRRTRKRVLLDEMKQVVPWAELLALIKPHAPIAKTGRPPFALSAMLRIHFMQQWFGLSDMAMEEALFDIPMYRDFIPNGPTIEGDLVSLEGFSVRVGTFFGSCRFGLN